MKKRVTTDDIRDIFESYGIRCYESKVRRWLRSYFNRETCDYEITEEMAYEFVYHTISDGIAFETWVKNDERIKHLISEIYALKRQVDFLEKQILELQAYQDEIPF